MASSERTQAAAAPAVAPKAKPAGRKRRRHPPPVPASPEALEIVRFECLLNARYHSAREAFLDSVHRWFMFGVIALGASAVLAILPDGSLIPGLFAAGAALIGALDLAFDLSNRARAHSLMKRRYFELLADLRDSSKSLDEAEACLHRYSADEEPAYHALIAASWNAAQEMLYGDDADAYSIPWRDRARQNFCRFEGRKYQLEER